MTMIHVFLDSSIYRQDPLRKSAAFQALARMGNADEIALHIPYFVKHEFLTHRREEYEKLLRDVKSGLAKLTKKPLSTLLTKAFGKHSDDIQLLSDDVLNSVNEEFDSWCVHVGAQHHSVKDHHGGRVAELYFSGEPPFSEPKSRKDIPDAFIYLSVLDIAKSVDELAVVAADKQLLDACSAVNNIVTYGSIDDFIKSDQCAVALKEVEVIENFEALIEKLKQKSAKINKLASSKLFDELVNYTFSDPSIPDDNNEAMISMLDVPEDVGLDFDEAEYYGKGVIPLPFEFEMEILATYYIFKSDYYCLNEERAKNISVSEYDNRHYFKAEEDFSLTVTGRIAVTVDFSKVPHGESLIDHLDALVEDVGVEVSEIADVIVNAEDNGNDS